MRSIDICIISGIQPLGWIPVNGKARILASANWLERIDSGFMRTSIQGPRTTDHMAGRVDSVIILSKRRQNSGRKEADSNHCICMVKKIKIKIKTTIEKVSICHFGLLVLVYNNNDCQIV